MLLRTAGGAYNLLVRMLLRTAGGAYNLLVRMLLRTAGGAYNLLVRMLVRISKFYLLNELLIKRNSVHLFIVIFIVNINTSLAVS